MKPLLILTELLALVLPTQAKPLKVFILAGQSNMEGHAKIETFDYIGDDPATAPLLKKMRGTDAKPTVCDRWATGGEQSEPVQLYNLAATMPGKVAEMKTLLEKLITAGRTTPGAAQTENRRCARTSGFRISPAMARTTARASAS